MADGFILALTGGIGGAKLCLGLQRVLPAGTLRIAVNTGDDFEHLGLRICPDVDTTIYTLGGLSNPELGWGRRDETFRGADSAAIAEGVQQSLRSPDLLSIVIAPSNPYLSVDPILALPGMRSMLRERHVPVIAVTPIIGDAAVKGPTAKIMKELGVTPSPLAIVEHYRGLIDGFVLDSRDAALAGSIDVPVQLCDTLMVTMEDRERVASSVLEFSLRLA